MTTEEIRLTQFSKGGGCGCKIAPAVLQQMLATGDKGSFPHLLVGNESSDDAAVYLVNEDTAVVSTTDFFMPIVDNPFDFGRIAAANSISDVYAMGGTPLMAIAVLGWPVAKLPPAVAQQVLEGGRAICREAGIPLAGGHTIDSLEPIFGLAVTGTVSPKHLKKNNGAREGDLLFLTKPLGVGVMSTAVKREFLKEAHYRILLKQLTTLNSVGVAFGKIEGVHAMTDVTGFGLLGHLTEMAGGSNVSAEISLAAIKKVEGFDDYLQLKTIPGATARNWGSYGDGIAFQDGLDEPDLINLLADPQTNGGLLLAVDENAVDELKEVFIKNNLQEHLTPIGRCTKRGEKTIVVKASI
ncbi:MAG: selenide, water dikinase SelD [Bacteroidota bacterium]|nr:selenide, water dikinase SelD [Bacteroidota bacterium]